MRTTNIIGRTISALCITGLTAGCAASIDDAAPTSAADEPHLEMRDQAIESDDARSDAGEPAEEATEWPRATHTDGERSLEESARLALGDEGYARIIDAQRGAGMPAGDVHPVARVAAIEGDTCATDDDAPREEPPYVAPHGRAMPGEIAPRRTPPWARAASADDARDAAAPAPVAPAVIAMQADWIERGCAAAADARRADCVDHAYPRHLAAAMMRDPEVRPDRRRD